MSAAPERNYDLVDCKSSRPAGCPNPPFYMGCANNDNMVVPTNDNRSYTMYATEGGYQGYYDAVDPACGGGKVPCDLKFTTASTQVVDGCWKSCQTQNCHVNCVIGAVNAQNKK
jgi:hypothetical protein